MAQPGPNSPQRQPYTGPRTHYSANKHEFCFTMDVAWTPFKTINGRMYAMPFMFHPHLCPEFVQECRRHNSFTFAKCTCHIQRADGDNRVIGPTRHVNVPSRAFATRTGPYIGCLPADANMIVAPQLPEDTDASPWTAETRKKRLEPSSQFGFYPYTVVGVMGPSCSDGKTTAMIVYPQIHNAKDAMPTAWGAVAGNKIANVSANTALPFWGPYLSSDLANDGVKLDEEITIKLIIECQFRD